MLSKVLEFSIRNRFLVIFFVLLVGVLGLRSMRDLPIDAVPDVTNIQVQVLTNAPALAPTEVEKFITFPVETVMSGLPHLQEVRSVSIFGLSAVTIVFEEGTDIYFARQLVSERLSEARQAIPASYGTPELGPISSGLGEIFQFEVKGEPACLPGELDTDECYSSMELREILDWYVANQIRAVKGVVEVNSFGGELKTYQVTVLPQRLVAFNLNLGDVFSALERNNENTGGGYIVHNGEQRLIRGVGLVRSLDDIREIPITTADDGTPIRIGEIADVELAPMIRQGAVTRDGKGEVVTAVAMMLLGENTREVSQSVAQRVAEIGPTLPDGVTIDVFYDRQELVSRTIRTVATNLIEGGILVIVVLLLLLGNLRAGLIVAAVIPLSMLAAFIAMRLFDVSGNLMSLGALDFGLVIDGAVVMVEQIMRALGRHKTRESSQAVESTIYAAAREVARPVLFGVAIIVLVYVPIFTLQGVEGKMFKPMALTVIFALVASLVLALTFVPAMSATAFHKGVTEKDTWLFGKLQAAYNRALPFALRHYRYCLAIALILFLSAIYTTTRLGAEFIPELDEGSIAIQAVRLPDTPLEESIKYTTRIEDSLRSNFPDEVTTVVSKTGRAEIATDPMGVQISDIYVGLAPQNKWKRASNKAALVELISETLDREVPGQRYLYSQPIELRTNELISGVRTDVAVKIYGDDLDVLTKVSSEIAEIVRNVPGAGDVEAEQSSGLSFLNIEIDRAAASRYGVDIAQVANVVSSVAGHQVGDVYNGQRRFALQVRLDDATRVDLEALKNVPLLAAGGKLTSIGEVANLKFTKGPAQISRENVQRRVAIMANVRGRDLASFVAEAKKRINEKVKVPPGYFVEWGGQFKNLQEASARLAVAVPAALILIFFLLYMMYGAIRPSLIIYLNVPFAAVGGVFALWLRDMPLSVSAGVGFIALFGIAVLNGVVMVSHIRSLQKAGSSLVHATSAGAKDRLRPVLMTALTDGIGFFPMAISVSAGAEVQRPLATVVIGGLVTATLLTLFVLPIIYSRFGGEASRKQSRVTEQMAAISTSE